MTENNQHGEFDKVVADMGTLGLYYLLCLGKYTYAAENNHPFCMQGISFQSTTASVNATIITHQHIDRATMAHMEFTSEKNGEKGKAFTHGDNDEPLISPLKALQ
jgi:hypothetical protein